MLLLLCVCLVSFVVGSDVGKPYYDADKAEELFEAYILTHDKIYLTDEEKKMRLEIFKESLMTINERNTLSNAVFDINHFSDLTEEETRRYTGFEPSSLNLCDSYTDKDVTTKDAPDSLNWVDKGAVTAVKDQGHCGSCWVFSCIGNIEGQNYMKTTQLQRFSEQELLDCSSNPQGCDGGDMAQGLIDLKNLGGVELESSYPPYAARQGQCQFDKTKVQAKILGCKKYTLVEEIKLKELLAHNGPLIIGINAARIMNYHKGIISRQDCEAEKFEGHAVLLVGYGTENGVDYWLIKNSWGRQYGEEGYLRISRGENTCQLMSYIATAEL